MVDDDALPKDDEGELSTGEWRETVHNMPTPPPDRVKEEEGVVVMTIYSKQADSLRIQ